LRLLLAASLGAGALISIAWLTHDLWMMGLPPFWLFAKDNLGFFDLVYFRATIVFRAVYAVAIYIFLSQLIRILRTPRPDHRNPEKE
jgi:hypothetical protein